MAVASEVAVLPDVDNTLLDKSVLQRIPARACRRRSVHGNATATAFLP